MKTSEIRTAFLEFFKAKGHRIVDSSSLIPAGDPTLLFANAGMVQFKDTFLGTEKRDYTRATTCQKCLRISGKHNDLENVGRTARHHTFFEMLGNFSFGDYFKNEAISYAWEFITKTLGLPKDRLWVTIFEDDDEAEQLWQENSDISKDRILRRGMKDNFWAMGDTGPCGPCSEIFYYIGPDAENQRAELLLADDSRYVEIWNLVFMQYNRDSQGKLDPLPRPSVDTGMGLERVAAVKQDVQANYDTDLLRGLIATAEELCKKSYDGSDYSERNPDQDPQYGVDVAMRVIADHARASSFLIADGILPSSDGRGYVLRRLIRRACRHGRVLGLRQAFLYQISSKVVNLMAEAYPQLVKNQETIARVIRKEEEKFLDTLDTGLTILNKAVEELKLRGSHVFPGETAFLLHDTYGFPLDMTEDIILSQQLTVDRDAFSAEMEKQRERSRSARASETAQILQRSVRPIPTGFRGYEYTEYESKVLALFSEEGEVQAAKQGEEIALIAEETPFYAEAGGQIGDTGRISSNDAALDVIDTQRVGSETIVHICRVLEGEITTGTQVRLSVEDSRRTRLRAHHSATHLLHLALREVLGEHVKQSGSRVSDQSLRFDFTHNEQVTQDQLQEIESIVNQLIRENHEVLTESLPIEEAKKSGAVALFGEKYGSNVRVVQIGSRSRELCGGTHAGRSGDIGSFTILSEGAISSGVRRMEAFAGVTAQQYIASRKRLLDDITALVNTGETQVVERLDRILQRNRELERNLDQLKQQMAVGQGSDLTENALVLQDGTKVITGLLEEASPKQLREMADDLRARIGSGCLALATISKGKAVLLTAVTPDLVDRYHAGKLMTEIAQVAGSRGGGRADLAQAGGGDPERIEQALQRFQELVS